MKAYLVGFMGVGKTTVGVALAARLQWELCDIDDRVAGRAGKTVEAIFAEDGEEAFRDAETRELAAVAVLSSDMIVATGGGIVLRDGNWARMRESGITIWLQADAATIMERVREGPVRPLLSVDDPEVRVRALLAERESRYRMADAAVCTTSRPVDAIVGDIVVAMESLRRARGGGGRP